MAVGIGQRCLVRVKITDVELRNARGIVANVVSPEGEKCQEVSFDEVSGLVYVAVDVNSAGSWSMWLGVRYDKQAFYTPAFVFAEVEGDATPCEAPYIVDVEVSGESVSVTPPSITPSGGDVAVLFATTHSELKAKRDAGQLVAGAFYRITDYETTTSQSKTRSAGHPFDIIVQALSNDTLSELAQAAPREGDTYFANSNLAAWKLRYTLDNDTTRFAWAKKEVVERAQSWTAQWGVLESKNNADNSSNYTTAVVGGRTKYLYAPAERGTYLDSKTFYRNILVGSITSTNGFIYEADNAPYDEGEDYWYWDEVSEIRVKTADGKLVTTLYHNYDNVFYDGNDDMQEYSVQFSPDYTEVDGVYRFTPESGVEDWWEYVYGGSINTYEKEYYTGSKSALYYAFDTILPKSNKVVTEVYSTETQKVYMAEGTLDTVVYQSYIAPVEGGKGVIYRMQDENGNDAPFDFKNIQFEVGGVWYYTFSFLGKDLSLTDYGKENYIAPHNKDYGFGDTTNAIVEKLPMLVFDAKANASGKTGGVVGNKIYVAVTSGYISATRIESLVWKFAIAGQFAMVDSVYINLTSTMFGNTIVGGCTTFTVGTSATPATSFRNNEVVLPIGKRGSFECKCSTFVSNRCNLQEASAGFKITSGSMTSCYIENSYYDSNDTSDAITFNADIVMRNCSIKVYNDLSVTYANTTSTNTPLRFVNIDARGWSETAVSIVSTFPANAPYTLTIAKNSAGVIKQWCEADLA